MDTLVDRYEADRTAGHARPRLRENSGKGCHIRAMGPIRVLPHPAQSLFGPCPRPFFLDWLNLFLEYLGKGPVPPYIIC